MASKKHKSSRAAEPVDSGSAKVAKTPGKPSSPLKNPNPMPSKKHKSGHTADPADSRSTKVAKTSNNLFSSLGNPNPSPNPNVNPGLPKSSKKKSNLSTDSMAKEPNPSSQSKLKAQDSNNGDDTLTILNGVIEFRMKNGVNPTPSSIKRFHDDLRGSLHSEITEDKLYNKLRLLRRKFRKIASSGAGPSDHDRAFYDLSLKAWETADETQKKKTEPNGKRVREDGEEEDQEMEDLDGEDAADDDSLKYFIHEMRGYWKSMGLPESDLDLGLKMVDRAKAKAVEKKLRDCLETGMKLRVKRHGLRRELAVALVAAHKVL